MPLKRNPLDLCTDNAAMIAWMGWELINAQMNVDIRSIGKFNDLSHNVFPLGNHTQDLIDIKSKSLRTIK